MAAAGSLAMAGVLLFVLPEILGGGAPLVDRLAAEDFTAVTPRWLVMLAGLFLAKFLFTVICSGSGVPGGIFLPMLVLGAVGGAFFTAAAALLGVLPDPVPRAERPELGKRLPLAAPPDPMPPPSSSLGWPGTLPPW